MNFDKLRYVVQVAKSGSLLDAAKSLHITQSALSQALTKVEADLNIKIFNRTRDGTIPTKLGLDIIKQSEKILNEYHLLEKIAKHQKAPHLRIGTIATSLNYLPKTLAEMKKQEPHTVIELEENSSQAILKGIINQQYDLGLVASGNITKDKYSKELHFYTLLHDNLQVVINAKDPLAKKQEISFKEIKEYPIALFEHEQLRQLAKCLEMMHGSINVFFSSSYVGMIQQLIIEDLAITIAPGYITKNILSNQNTEISLLDVTDSCAHYEFTLVWRKNHENKEPLQKMINILMDQFSEDSFVNANAP